MQSNEIRLGVLSALLGGVLVAGLGALALNTNLVRAAKPAAEPQTTIVVAAPEVSVPGYFGPLFNSQGSIVAVSVENKKSAFAPTSSTYSSTGRPNQDRSTGAASAGTAAIIFDRVSAKKN